MLRQDELTTPFAEARDEVKKLMEAFMPEQSRARYLDALSGLSDKKCHLLHALLKRLEKNALLNAASLQSAFERVAFKPSAVTVSDIEEVSVGSRTRLTLSSGATFFINRNKPEIDAMTGSRGYVHEGLASETDELPAWAVKELYGSFKEKDIKDARHEAKYNQVLGRQSFTFIANKHIHIMYPWLQGVSLEELVEKGNLQAFQPERRLKWLASLLTELNKLHEVAIVHRDLIPKNVVVNPEVNEMTLIDFGISHRENIREDRSQLSDMNDLALSIIKVLFDDVMRAESAIVIGKAMRELYGACYSWIEESRCTSQQALEYCQQLLKNYNNLDDKKLQEILDGTLNRRNLTPEDVMRGSTRALKFK